MEGAGRASTISLTHKCADEGLAFPVPREDDVEAIGGQRRSSTRPERGRNPALSAWSP
jgi:hypothetical protein